MATRVEIDLTLSDDDDMDVDPAKAQGQAEASLRAFGARKHVQETTTQRIPSLPPSRNVSTQFPPQHGALPDSMKTPKRHLGQAQSQSRASERVLPQPPMDSKESRRRTPESQDVQLHEEECDSSDDSLVELALSLSAAKKRAAVLEEQLMSRFRQQPPPQSKTSNKRKRDASTSSADSVAGPPLPIVGETTSRATVKYPQGREAVSEVPKRRNSTAESSDEEMCMLLQSRAIPYTAAVQWPGTMATLGTTSRMPDVQDHAQPAMISKPALMSGIPNDVQGRFQQAKFMSSTVQPYTPLPSKGYKGRSRSACYACSIAKTGCDGGIPCKRCSNRGVECRYWASSQTISTNITPLASQQRATQVPTQPPGQTQRQGPSSDRSNPPPHHSLQQPSLERPVSTLPLPRRSACVACNVAHTKCVGGTPCNRCFEQHIKCEARPMPLVNQGLKRTSEGLVKALIAEPTSALLESPQVQNDSYFTLGLDQQQGFLGSNVFDKGKLAAAARLSRSVLPVSDDEYEPVEPSNPVQLPSTPSRQALSVPSLTPRSGQRDQAKDARILELKRIMLSQGLAPGVPATAEEDELCDLLKDYIGMAWSELGTHFPHRHTWHSVQARYSARSRARRGIPIGKASLLKSTDLDEGIIQSSRLNKESSASADDVSMSDIAAPVARRPKRAAAEAVKQGVYRISRNHQGFGAFPDEFEEDISEQPEPISRPRSRMLKQHETPMIQHTVTALKPSVAKPSLRHKVEASRDSAALSAMTYKLPRAPYIEQRMVPRRRLIHKRSNVSILAPYLSSHERQQLPDLIDSSASNSEWNDKVLHVDFTEEEIRIVEPCISQVIMGTMLQPDKPLRQWVVDLMASANQQDIKQIVRSVQSSGKFIKRTTSSLESFLRDLVMEQHHQQPLISRLVSRCDTSAAVGTVLGRRELGLDRRQSKSTHLQLKQTLLENTFGPTYVLKKASSDVTNVAWSPDGNIFAAGATALTDDHSMQYNRRNNLLVGNLSQGRLSELPAHAIKRLPTNSGANASHAMHQSQDPLLYTTISAVKFSPDGKTMFTAGYDKMARVWDIDETGRRETTQRWQFRHKAPIDLLEVNENGVLFATGVKQSDASIKILRYGADALAKDLLVTNFRSEKAAKKPDSGITPSALRWGPAAGSQDRYLVAGFSSATRDSAAGEGETCIWDVETRKLIASRGGATVFDIAWSPSFFGVIAVAGSPTGHVNRGTKSTVRIYDSERTSGLSLRAQALYELECPALDMNDVIFNAGDANLITTGCTDGRVYLWDLRRPDKILHCFAHGKSLVELDHTQPAEALDTGIRFVSWGESRRTLFSGSSDGVVALWDPYKSPEDAHTKNIIQLGSGVMSGAFSPDFSNLLLGEEDGTVTMLSVGHEDSTLADCEQFDYIKASKEKFEEVYHFCEIEADEDTNDEGIDAAKELIENGEIVKAPLAGFPRGQAVQGPNYKKTFDYSEETVRLRRQAARFQRDHRPHHNQCQLEHPFSLLTEEERGVDSYAWKQHVPAAVRALAGSSSLPSVLQEKLDCFHCHSAKLAVLSSKLGDDILGCHLCCSAWRVDVLGYTPVSYHTHEVEPMPSMDAVEQVVKGLAELDVALEDD